MIDRGWKRSEALVIKSLDCLEQTVGRNTDITSDYGAVSDRNEEHDTGNWRKDSPCYKVVKNLACVPVFCGKWKL